MNKVLNLFIIIITVMLFVYLGLFGNFAESIKKLVENIKIMENQFKIKFRHFIELNLAHTDNMSVKRQQL